ncbi:hypothetical protein DNTS_007829 [Danionella cerebrum]|uniref:Uncharacterized protein n=1 Tax=Danionella cerebrum TaxID=2873325 RepID=A0A553RH69_9TELE|nr:hypothetical protein DNTS_007829 [Danionella translucida]
MICLAHDEDDKNPKSRKVVKKPSFLSWGLKNKQKSSSTLSLPNADYSGPWSRPCSRQQYICLTDTYRIQMTQLSPQRGSLMRTMTSRINFSFRRKEKEHFRNIAHGLIPAATIAPRPAVPRTPPPRSPNPSPERPRSALAAAILSSSLTGRTVAIPPPRHRSYSESDCSRADSQTGFEPYAATALYTRDRWPDSASGRPPALSPGQTDHYEDEDSDELEGLDRDDPLYQSIEKQARDEDINVVYAVPIKPKKDQSYSGVDEEAEDSAFEIGSPLQTEEETAFQEGAPHTQPSPLRQPRSASCANMASPELDQLSPQSNRSRKSSKRKSLQMDSPLIRNDRDMNPETVGVLHSTLEVQQALVKELREQTQILSQERQTLEKRCAQQSQHIAHLQQERGNSSGASDLMRFHT